MPTGNINKDRLTRYQKLQAKKFSRYFLLLVLAVVTYVFYNMIKIFLVPIILAAVFTSLFFPLYNWLLKIFKNRRGLNAFICCVILLLGLLIPTYIVANLVSHEAINLYQTAEEQIREIIKKGDKGPLGKIKSSRLVARLNLNQIDWQDPLQKAAQTAGKVIATVINKTSKETFQFVTNLFITFFTMFYFFRDGDKLIERLKYLSPLEDIYEEALIFRFNSIAKATIKGTLLIGFIQGSLGGIILWIFGISSPILWGVVMIILSIIPMVGAWLVLLPAAIIQIIVGNVWQGIAIILLTVLLVSSIDNLLRPRLVGQSAKMHDLMVFFSTLGGIYMFGAIGFIVGPIIAVFFLTILDIYSIEFKQQLDIAQQLEEHAPLTPLTETKRERTAPVANPNPKDS